MTRDELLSRITADPAVLTGKPVIRGTRLSVEYVLEFLGGGGTVQQFLADYPGLTEDDVRACLLFAGAAMADTTFVPTG